MVPLPQLPRSLTDTISDWIFEQILRGELRPGDELNIDALSRQFGISQTPIREAIRVLQAEGIVVHPPRRSPKVAPLDRKAVSELYQCRAELHSLAARWAIEKMADGDMERVRAVIARMREAVQGQDREAYYKLTVAFTDLILEFADNAALSDVVNMLRRRCPHFRYLSLKDEGRLEAGLRFHETLLEALEHKDSDCADRLMHELLFEARDMCLTNLPEHL